MFNVSGQNQNLETTQLANNTHNKLILNDPQITQPNIQVSPNNNPQNTINFNPQFNPTYNPQFNPVFNPVINTNPHININNELPKIEIKPRRILAPRVKLDNKSKKMNCPYCEEFIETETEKSLNIKALLTAIATFYIGFVVIQACKNKDISFQDCEHTCPKCGTVIGKYYVM